MVANTSPVTENSRNDQLVLEALKSLCDFDWRCPIPMNYIEQYTGLHTENIGKAFSNLVVDKVIAFLDSDNGLGCPKDLFNPLQTYHCLILQTENRKRWS